jgi:hypothetical protein
MWMTGANAERGNKRGNKRGSKKGRNRCDVSARL